MHTLTENDVVPDNPLYVPDDDPRIRCIRVWPPFWSMTVVWVNVIEASQAGAILDRLGLTVDDLWRAENMSPTPAYPPGLQRGDVPELQGQPVLILKWEYKRVEERGIWDCTGCLDAEKTVTINREWSAIQRERRASQEKRRQQERAVLQSEGTTGTWQRAVQAQRAKEADNHPAVKMKKLEEDLAAIKKINAELLKKLAHEGNGHTK